MKIKIIKTCYDCEHCHHTGRFSSNPKYVCQHKEVSKRNKVATKYWYDYPIIKNAMKLATYLEIPKWCPLEDYKNESED